MDGNNALVVDLSGLTRRFGSGERRVTAVDGIDLRIKRGEVVALLGPNGAGKTVTLDMLLGLSEPDAGDVRVLGKPPRHATTEGRLAAVLQTGGLLADLTVAETVEVIASFHRAKDRLPEVMARTELDRIARRKVSKCSGGEQQRIKFALALLPNPDVLVLDEPTAGMDVTARRRFWEVMRAEAREGRTIVFATHYLEEAEQFAVRTVVLNRGKIIADGDTADLRRSLGGRTVSAVLPEVGRDAVLEDLRRDAWLPHGSAEPVVGGTGEGTALTVTDGRITVRTEHSDALAKRLLELGAHDLEIAAPTLESAFTTLTED
ncbi:ABC transporter ATP-binding protein [Leucobacter sp. GX24907]